MARGWTFAPEWLKDLYQLRPCLLYICIAQFHKAVGNYQWPSSSYLNHYYSVSSWSLPCLPASSRSSRLIGNHLVWLTRILSDQYLAPSPVRWEKTNQVFVYLKPVFTLAFGIQYRSASFLIWINEKLMLFFTFPIKFQVSDFMTQFWNVFCVNQLLPEPSSTTEAHIY